MAGSPTWKGPTNSLVEVPGSPSYELAEKIQKTRTYTGLYSLCVSGALAKGTVGVGGNAGYVVSKCSVSRQRGDIGTVAIVWEAGADSGQPLPLDEYSVEPVELNPRLEKHPYFASITEPHLDLVHNAAIGSDSTARNQARGKVEGLATADAAAAQYLLSLMSRGVETYYLAGARYTWVASSYTAPSATMGGFIQTPLGTPWFTLPVGWSWLREADALEQSGGIYKIKRSWLGGPGGHWDTTLYAA